MLEREFPLEESPAHEDGDCGRVAPEHGNAPTFM